MFPPPTEYYLPLHLRRVDSSHRGSILCATGSDKKLDEIFGLFGVRSVASVPVLGPIKCNGTMDHISVYRYVSVAQHSELNKTSLMDVLPSST